MHVKRLVGVTSIALVAGCTGAEHVSAPTPPRAPLFIIGGIVDSSDPAVAFVVLEDASGEPMAGCSGELISPKVVLTAAHCSDNTYGLVNHQVFFASSFNWSTRQFTGLLESHSTSMSVPDPKWDGNPWDGYDVGLLLLDSPSSLMPLLYNTTPLDNTYLGQNVRFVGWGRSSTTDYSPVAEKRTVTTTLSGVMTDPPLLYFSSNTQGACEGDSGGPELMTIGSEEVIAGITSFGSGVCGQGWDTKVDAYTSFISDFITQYDAPSLLLSAKLDVTAGPPPGFQLKGGVTLAGGVTAIDPTTQPVTLNVGTYSATIPPGSFYENSRGYFSYAGGIGGVSLQVIIKPARADSYSIAVDASGVDLTALTDPVMVRLLIGINYGTTQADTEF